MYIPTMWIKQAVINGFVLDSLYMIQILEKLRHTQHICISNWGIVLDQDFTLNINYKYTIEHLSMLGNTMKKYQETMFSSKFWKFNHF